MGDDITQQDNNHIIAGITYRSITTTEEIKNRVEKQQCDDCKSKPDDNIQYQYIAKYPLCGIVIFLSQFHRNQCSRTYPHQRAESRGKIH